MSGRAPQKLWLSYACAVESDESLPSGRKETHAVLNSIHCNLKLEVCVLRWMALLCFANLIFHKIQLKRGLYMSFYSFTSSPKEAFPNPYAFSALSRFLTQGDVVGVRRRIGDWLELVQDVGVMCCVFGSGWSY